tara:strand:+ start:320 stop:724 length:405 start_codon:yes stop_codon:yes gene_type:complete
MTVYLLDLNYTLVTNSNTKASPFTKQIDGETYSRDLVDKMEADGSKAILISARPHMHAERTLDSIYNKIKWVPMQAYFNDLSLAPPLIKKSILERFILPFYEADGLFGIESNPKTRQMYAEFGIKSVPMREFMA